MALPLGKSHDPQRFRSHVRVAWTLVSIAVLALTARLALVQMVRGDRYQKYAVIERVSRVRAQAPRGLVKAADGTVLARNIESHSLEVMTNRVKPERVLPLAQTLRELLYMTDGEYADLVAELNRPVDPRKRRPLTVRRDLVSTHCPYDSTPLELVAEQPHGYCSACGRHFEAVPQKRTCPFDQRRLLAVGQGWHCPACERDFHQGSTCPYDGTTVHSDHHILQCSLCRRTFNDEVAVLRANQHRLAETRVVAEIQREYPYRFLASHVLGHIGYVTPRDIEPLLPFGTPRHGLNDRVGRAGIEMALEPQLSGLDGEQVLVKRSGGEEAAKDLEELIAAIKPRAVTPGANVRLTLHMDLQRAVKQAMKDVYSGAAVVIDPNTGYILAMYAKPSFDPNALSGKRAPQSRPLAEIAAYAPLLNKALHGYPPASTYKVVPAIAALEDGLVTAKTEFTCGGHYDFGGRRFHCHNRRGHGEVDVHDALVGSCDVYFYKVGEQLGIERLDQWSRKLGFGEPTGVELRESIGRVPSREWYRTHVPGGYYPGFALSTAVGQKDVMASPLQLARVYAALANGGELPSLTVVAGLEDAQGRLVAPNRLPSRRWEVKASTMRIVRTALRAVVNEQGGTAFTARPNSASMAGKTGTAQAPQRLRKELAERMKDDPAQLARLTAWLQNDHAWFAGWAPWNDPQIVVVVLVEHGGSGGHNAAPIARQIVDAWFAKHPAPPEKDEPPPRERKKAAPLVEDPAAIDDASPQEPEHQPTLPEPEGAERGEDPAEVAP